MKKIIFTLMMIIPVNFYSQRTSDESTVFLSLGNVELEKLNDVEEKKKFLGVIDAEKGRISNYVLSRILDSAYELYRNGDYEGASAIARKVLSLDPKSEEAKMIASIGSSSTKGPGAINVSIEDQLQDALSLYQKGEVLDAYRKIGVIVRLSPNNIKAKYWHKKIEGDLKDYYVSKAEELYSSGDKKNALVTYYRALEFAPKDNQILESISKIENEIRQDKVNEKLKYALEVYANGKAEDAYKILGDAIAINPADEKVNKLYKDLKSEIENKYIKEGDSYYYKKQYLSSIKSFTKALAYSDNPSKIEKIISNIKSKMKKEEEFKKKKEEERRKKEEERKKKEAEEKLAQKHDENQVSKSTDTQKTIVSEQNKIAAQQHWVEGVKFLQSGDYQKAKEEFTIAKKLDPTNQDIEAALKRIEQILSGGQ